MEKPTQNEIEDVSIGRKKDISELVDKLLIQVKKAIETDLKINTGDVIQLTSLVLELVEKSGKVMVLTSKEKFYVASDVIMKALENIPKLSEQDRKDIEILLPNTIETIVQASKGKFSFGTKKKKENKVKIDTVKVSLQLYDRLVKFIKKEKYDAKSVTKNVSIMVIQLMSLVEEYPSLLGSEKKAIVINVMQKLLDEINILFPDVTEEQKNALKLALALIPGLIDTIVYSTKGKIDLNAVVENVKGCFRKCLPKIK